MRLTKKAFLPRIIIAIIFLVNPNINIIDIFPDFVGYFLIVALIGRLGDALPYFAEAKGYFKKLAFLSLAKIPALLIMLSNLKSGSDIIPLFTLVFSVLELLWLIPAIDNLFSAIFYVGERSNAGSIINPFPTFGIKIRPETLKALSYIFFVAKTVLCTIPEFCLLSSENMKLLRFMRTAYFPMLFLFLFITVVLGIIWGVSVFSYARKIKKDKGKDGIFETILGFERLDEIKREAVFKRKLSAVTLFATAMIFLLDVRLEFSGEVSIIPRFLFPLIMLFFVLRCFDRLLYKLLYAGFALVYSVISTISSYMTLVFFENHDYMDLYLSVVARSKYDYLKLFSIFEAVSLAALLVTVAIGIFPFIRESTALSPKSPRYSREDADYHRSCRIKSYLLISLAGVVGVLKCLQVILNGRVDISFETGVVIVTSAPWLRTLTFFLTLILVLASFLFISGIKTDMSAKHKEGEGV